MALTTFEWNHTIVLKWLLFLRFKTAVKMKNSNLSFIMSPKGV